MKLHDALNVATFHPEDVLGIRRSFMTYGRYIKLNPFDNTFVTQTDDPYIMTCGDIIATDWEVIYKGLVFSQYKILMNIIKESTGLEATDASTEDN